MRSILQGSHQQVPVPGSWKELDGKEVLNFVSSCVRACVCVHVFILVPGVDRLTNSGVASYQICNSMRLISICAQQPESFPPPGAPSPGPPGLLW